MVCTNKLDALWKLNTLHTMSNLIIESMPQPVLKTCSQNPPALKDAQQFVGGYVELMTVKHKETDEVHQLLFNEEGRLQNLDPNINAMKQYGIELFGNVLALKDEALWT